MKKGKYNIGLTLKRLRLENCFTDDEVCKNLNIVANDLQQIESGLIAPTWPQIQKFANLYKQDGEYLYAQLISDESIICEPSSQWEIMPKKHSSLESFLTYPPYELENRRYIGSKAKLTGWIMQTLKSEASNLHTFCDIFAGTGVVANKAIETYDTVIVNDTLNSNNIIYGAFFAKGEWSIEKLCDILKSYNTIIPSSLKANWFSKNYGDKYFSMDTAKIIGYVRQDIEERKSTLSEKEYNILLASLIYSIDRLANTVGHYDAYIKKEIKQQPLVIKLVNVQSLQNVIIYQEDANSLAKKINADIVYLDPPYNSRQYCRFYHIYETIVKWDKPELFGVALKPKAKNMSVYCTSKAVDAFENIIKTLNTKVIAVSYNNTYNSKSNSSRNKIQLSQIKQILDERGPTKVYEHKHKFFNAGKTDFTDHKEFLFITKTE